MSTTGGAYIINNRVLPFLTVESEYQLCTGTPSFCLNEVYLLISAGADSGAHHFFNELEASAN